MFQLAIKGGAVIDGTGKPAFRADIGIRHGKVAVIGDLVAVDVGRASPPASCTSNACNWASMPMLSWTCKCNF